MRTNRFLLLLMAVTLLASACMGAELPVSTSASPSATPVKEDPCVPVPKNTVWKDGNTWMKTHERYVNTVQKYPPAIVFFGDSITQWWPWMDFKARYGTYGGADFGIGGDQTQHLLWRILNGEMEMKPKVAVVMIGTNNLGNNPPESIAAAITKIVQTIQEKSPATKVLLLGIFPRGWDEKGFPGLRPRIRKVNAIIAKLDDGKNVRYLDIESTLLEPDGTLSKEVSSDSLHLKMEGYMRWAKAMQPLLEEMMGKPLPFIPTPTPTPNPQ